MGTSNTLPNASRGLWSRNSPDKAELSQRLGRSGAFPRIEWGQYSLKGRSPEAKGFSGEEAKFLAYLQQLTLSLCHRLQESPRVAAFQAALQEHLEENPDVAADTERVEMLRYCLYTYCRIHPDFADFTLRERVKAASHMAGEFLRQLHRYTRTPAWP